MERQNAHETEAIGRLLDGDNDGLRRYTHAAREIHRKLQGLVAQSYPGLDPIEPELLTKLIEFGETIHGIVVGRCPGAGGWDALAFLIERDLFDKSSIDAIVAKAKEYDLVLKHLPLRLL
jgi:phosphomevalonate kinase